MQALVRIRAPNGFNMRWKLYWVWLYGLLVATCHQKNDANNKLLVAVAANVQFAIRDIERDFEQETGILVELITGSSGKLTAQVLQSAPFDIFIAADLKYPDTLFQQGFSPAPPRVYAYGTLVLWTTQELDLNQWQKLLEQDAVQKIAIANPATAPYGLQTIHLLKHYKLYEKVQSKLVLGESIAQTNQYIASGACEIGFTAKSIVLAPEMQGKGKWIAMNPSAYQPIAQGAVITQHGAKQHPDASQRFFSYLFSEKGQSILAKYGYQLP